MPFGLGKRQRGQTSVEFLLVAALILVVAVAILSTYQTQALKTSAFAVVRSDVDRALLDARMDGCYGELSWIKEEQSQGKTVFVVNVSDCSEYINKTRSLIHISQALGCRKPSNPGACKGRVFDLEVV